MFQLRCQPEWILPGATHGYPKLDSGQRVPTPAITYGDVTSVLKLKDLTSRSTKRPGNVLGNQRARVFHSTIFKIKIELFCDDDYPPVGMDRVCQQSVTAQLL